MDRASRQTLEAAKQASRREQNESTARARTPAGDDASFRCECGDDGCSCAVTLTLTEYEAVRGDATHFVIVRHHENPESERVIEENERFAVVETVTGEATKLARRSDPRLRRRERCWRESHHQRSG